MRLDGHKLPTLTNYASIYFNMSFKENQSRHVRGSQLLMDRKSPNDKKKSKGGFETQEMIKKKLAFITLFYYVF